MSVDNRLKVFLCHSSGDKPAVRELYRKLAAEGWIDPWLDEEKLLPGQDWTLEIEKAVEAAHIIIVCLTKNSVNKEGFVQRELRLALDIALTKPEETIFVIPLRLEECDPPRRLRAYHYADYFPADERERAYGRLLASLRLRGEALGIAVLKSGLMTQEEKLKPPPAIQREETAAQWGKAPGKPSAGYPVDVVLGSIAAKQAKVEERLLNLEENNEIAYEKGRSIAGETWGGIEFVRIPAGPFLMGSKKDDKLAFDGEKPQHTVDLPYDYWMARFPVTNELYARFVGEGKHPVSEWGQKKDHPVVKVSWKDAMAYCRWLNDLLSGELPPGLVLRLPTEAEWEKAARGTDGREWPWGTEFDKDKCNSYESGKGNTTPVGLYSPEGDSPDGCADMAGNVWEWCHSLYQSYPYRADDGRENGTASGNRVLRGGSFSGNLGSVRCASRYDVPISSLGGRRGFRVAASPISPET